MNIYEKCNNMTYLSSNITYIGEINQIRIVPVYGHSSYLRNQKSYKKNCNE